MKCTCLIKKQHIFFSVKQPKLMLITLLKQNQIVQQRSFNINDDGYSHDLDVMSVQLSNKPKQLLSSLFKVLRL